MAFYDSNPNQATASTSSASGLGQLPHLAPQGDLTVSSDAPEVSLNFTEAQVEEYKEQDRFLPVCLGFYIASVRFEIGGNHEKIKAGREEADDRSRTLLEL